MNFAVGNIVRLWGQTVALTVTKVRSGEEQDDIPDQVDVVWFDGGNNLKRATLPAAAVTEYIGKLR